MDASAGTAHRFDKAFLTDPFNDLHAISIALDDTAKFTGWDSVGIMGFCANSVVELRLKNTEHLVIEPTVLDLPELVSLGKLFLELDA